MSVKLLQRLSVQGVSFVLDSVADGGLSPAASRAVVAQRASMLSFAATGGVRDANAVVEIGERLRGLAREVGFPEDKSSAAHACFDRIATIYLGPLPEFSTGEGLRDDMWAYFATVVVPDVVAWRFPDRSAERFRGGVRNAIQRLWLRGVILDRGSEHPQRWGLVEVLKEDAAVQIFERPGIFGQPVLAKALAEGYAKVSSVTKQGMESVMRRATKLLRLRNEVYDLGGLSKSNLDRVVAECFQAAELRSR